MFLLLVVLFCFLLLFFFVVIFVINSLASEMFDAMRLPYESLIWYMSIFPVGQFQNHFVSFGLLCTQAQKVT